MTWPLESWARIRRHLRLKRQRTEPTPTAAPNPPLVPPTRVYSPLTWNRVRKVNVDVAGGIVHSMGERVVNDSERWGPVGTFDAADWLNAKTWSAHSLNTPNGTILELVKPELVAFHAGRSELDEWSWLNENFLGCEWLVAGVHDYASWLEAIQKPDCYTAEQYDAGGWQFATWASMFGERFRIVSHSVVAGDHVRGEGKGKRDPGPGFDWDRFLESVDAWKAELS